MRSHMESIYKAFVLRTVFAVAVLAMFGAANTLRVAPGENRGLAHKMGKGMNMMGKKKPAVPAVDETKKSAQSLSSSKASTSKSSSTSKRAGSASAPSSRSSKSGSSSSKQSGKGKGSSKSSLPPRVESDIPSASIAPSGTPTFFVAAAEEVGPSTAPTECPLGVCDSVPFSINWTTEEINVNTDGGWEIANDGRRIRFNIEDSDNCGGPNFLTQLGTAQATIVAPVDYLLTVGIDGNAELQSSGFERMSVTLDGTEIISGTSDGQGLGCAMGPPQVTTFQNNPLFLSAGTHTFAIDFTTGDGAYHVDAFYEFLLAFQPVP